MHPDTLTPVWLADPVERHHPLNRGRVAWWLCLPGLDGGRQWFDLMGLNHGTLTNMSSASGWRGTARPGGWGHLAFDGSDDEAVAPASPALSITGSAVTMASWALSTATGAAANQYIVSKANGGTDSYGQGFFGTSVKSYLYPQVVTTAASLVNNRWYRFVTVATASAISQYLDGVLLSSTASTFGTLTAIAAAVTVGRLGGYASTFFPGSIDDVSVWSRALSADEVRADYDLSRAGYPGVLRRLPRMLLRGPSGGLLLKRRRAVA